MYLRYLIALQIFMACLSPSLAAADSPAEIMSHLRDYTITYDSTGNRMPTPDSMQHTIAYSGGVISTDTATDGTNIWVQTYSYTAGDLTGISKWVKQ